MNHTRHTFLRTEIEKLKKKYSDEENEDEKISIEQELDQYEIEMLTMGDDEDEDTVDITSKEYQEDAEQRLDDTRSADGDY